MIPRFPDAIIVECPALELFGIQLATTLNDAIPACELFLQSFLQTIQATPENFPICYGVSTVEGINPSFTYWATCDASQKHIITSTHPNLQASPPQPLSLQGGLYAATMIPAIGQRITSFDAPLAAWLLPNGYVYDSSRHAYERYDSRYTELRISDLYIPIAAEKS